jgi:hypothetical protein
LLPVTSTWVDDPGWFSWSGTSFATPCALATHAATSVAAALEPASLNGSGEYTECGINL